jgi:hypothetical protein
MRSKAKDARQMLAPDKVAKHKKKRKVKKPYVVMARYNHIFTRGTVERLIGKYAKKQDAENYIAKEKRLDGLYKDCWLVDTQQNES